MNFTRPLVLASKSPRRQQLLKDAGFTFETRTKEVEETYPDDLPINEVAEYLAKKKADAFKEEISNEIIITSDTVVIAHDEILGKPNNAQEATNMLHTLSGGVHQVMTGVCLLANDKQVSFSDTTDVTLKELSEDEITYYVTSYKPYDKAGAYGIQEWIGMVGITSISGSYFTVVGLPTHRLYEELMRF